jgi:hypothetical protein
MFDSVFIVLKNAVTVNLELDNVSFALSRIREMYEVPTF